MAAMYQRQPSYAGRNEHNIQQEEFHCSFRYAHSSSRGMRPTMEDAVCMRLDLPGLPNSAFFGVFDGHAGADAAGYASQVIITQFIQKMQASGRFGSGRSTRGRSAVISSWPPVLDDPYNIHIARTLTQAFCDTDLQIADKFVKSKKVRGPASDPGCTATCVLVTQDFFVFANLGDSRALLSSGQQLAFATRDHKPNDQTEKDRICEAGGFVLRGRVCAQLAVSRALGDHQFKDSRLPQAEQMVSPIPDITFVDRNLLTDDFLLVCCDGVFDVMSNSQALEFVRASMKITSSLGEVAARLVQFALKRGSTDNLSVVIVDLKSGLSETATSPTPGSSSAQHGQARPVFNTQQTILPPIAAKPTGSLAAGLEQSATNARVERELTILDGYLDQA